ncbi:beta-N-acetylhexosaminidase [Thermomonas sp.]|jgi:beta-N-acetylhexosaminidase|uniref:beta-N-acetylhexosaminidase n=1 Tax=Thermomonas sp. TaxID=1971895 RepID=UPI001B5A770F|nr:beta-N-acetylhexosaminidase [Thermomonas sp.]MBK6415781.1 beta-N-acetylhexosaminidase [Thermomonas sp.]MBK6924939.1 beta-N-acetylhexosaminidase [Thermomonas sp.]MBL0229152.1 beta-N-acetylhexosaminidase [Thermomonas sp.]MBP6438367.1 beta-N-acetylhexosaminidase [Thermomonas sp.]MBP7159068.1 beta-N-acetylhexosaminidase [Thermomonas sp.]
MLVIGVSGHELTARERDWLQHDACAGVILFLRNFASKAQVMELTQSIREAAPRPMLLCVDQEGGRVQRFRDGYSKLPPLEGFDALYRRDADAALELAREHAWLMASEIRATGLDISFAPVVDLARGNRAIGNRAFSPDPQVVAAFTRAYVDGMHAAGMAATLKHFPGHGSVPEDTHFEVAIDDRSLDQLRGLDLVPFAAGIDAGAEAVMMAHVTYPQVAPEPAGYSPRWIREILRQDMGFRGVVFADDIGMAAAFGAGGVKARIDAHLDAGCDVVPVCHPDLVEEGLRAVEGRALATPGLAGMMGRMAPGWDALLADVRYESAKARIGEVPVSTQDAGVTSGANDEANAT